jgi:hypothetical protein
MTREEKLELGAAEMLAYRVVILLNQNQDSIRTDILPVEIADKMRALRMAAHQLFYATRDARK